MLLKDFQSTNILGLSIRTSNQDEMIPSEAKIGDLWAQFYSEYGGKLTEKSNVYGVYTDYASDFNGQYSVYAAADTLDASDELIALTLSAGKYLVFSAQGEIPGSVIALWKHIWHYFSSGETAHERAYTTDFEHFKSATSVDIYIALKET
ncbi:GyrI-like domain-containing protein [Cognaticolwellia mytili]|uniref:GyrI-like domain-containing protein n=1 Tax=Cognaticolwellia mytili TaxID=1888913 RepID=UPI000A16D14C|nr:GyrI-like domain-containing protein [Cognaticolwellia mytili]